ncbi:MAG: RNA 2',3'-cyclic phosphodiesterase [Gammaproteobacteria bacterium]|nr:RNA 2',3'-cyclic phosphodiesterase [Gammaproteobacteria bacterium]
MKRLRLFFALWPSESEANEAAAAAITWLGAGTCRLVPPQRLHATLLFLGGVEVGLIDAVVSSAQGISESGFDLVLDEAAYWRRPQVAVLSPTEPPPALMSLAGQLREAMLMAGLNLESRSFRPHVTLARRVPRDPGGASGLPLRWQINGFGLYQSVTHQSGPEYSLLQHFPLIEPK